jgi:hypothetical protein
VKFINAIIFCTIFSFVYSQSKKEQIEILSIRVDSLHEVLNNDKKNNKIQNETLIHMLDSLKEMMANEKQSNFNHSTAISELNSNNKSINSELSKLNQEFALIKLKSDSISLMKSEIEKLKLQLNPENKELIKKQYSPVTFWNVKIGEADSNSVANYLKSKKKEGMPMKLGSYISSSRSDGIAIRAWGKIKLSNILTNSCDNIYYNFDENNICNNIDIDFYGSDDTPSNLFNIVVSDMERLFKSKASYKVQTDINDDKTQVATIKNNGAIIYVTNTIESMSSVYVSILCETKN